jgi:CBS domain-containing protein
VRGRVKIAPSVPTVADHMTRELLTIDPEASLTEAAKRMAARGVGAVVVLDADRLAGILTERDLLKAVAAGSQEALVSQWMTRHPETIEPGDDTDHAAALMIHGGFRHLPVTEGDQVVGILSIRDLMRIVLEDAMPQGV